MSGAPDKIGADRQVDFFEQPVVDRLIEVVLELTAELWVTRQRAAALEERLIARSLIEPGELEQARAGRGPTGRAERDAFVSRILGGLAR